MRANHVNPTRRAGDCPPYRLNRPQAAATAFVKTPSRSEFSLFRDLSDYTREMPEVPPEQVTPFVFSDPSGKRWPRLRLILLIGGVLFFVALVLFVQTLFVTPKMNVPFSLRQLKGQLRALQRENPAGHVSPASLLWQKFSAVSYTHLTLPTIYSV